MLKSKTIHYPGPADEALRKAAAYMTSKHQYEITHSSGYSITFNKVRKLGLLQLLDFQQAAYNETATLVANEVDGETRLNIGGSNRLARTDLTQAVKKMVSETRPAPASAAADTAVGDKALCKTNISLKEQLQVFADRLEVRSGLSLERVERSLPASQIESVTMERGVLTITDASGNTFVADRPTRAKKAYEAIQSIAAVSV